MVKKTKQMIKTNYKWGILLVFLILFLIILKDIFDDQVVQMDNMIYQLVVNSLRTEKITPMLKIITELGGVYFLVTTVILSWFMIKNKRIALIISANLILSTILNISIKNIIQRPRPEGYRLILESGYSFPSGHAMASMAFYGLLIYMIGKNVKLKPLKYTLIGLLSLIIFSIGLSRIYLGVHYASDVLGGFCLSIAYLVVFTTITKSMLKIQRDEKENELRNKLPIEEKQ